MNSHVLVFPMAALVLLTAIVLTRMLLGRIAAVKRGDVDARFYKTYQGEGEPRAEAQNTRQVINLFESPVLFYAACITAMVVGQETGLMLWLAWAYVGCRIVHAIIHLGGNRIPPRMSVYLVSWIVLIAMWVVLVLGVSGSL